MDIGNLSLLNPTLVVGNKVLTLASGDIRLDSLVQGSELQLQISTHLVDQLVNAWLELAHSIQPTDFSRPTFDIRPDSIESSSSPDSTAISHFNVEYHSISRNGVSFDEVEYRHIHQASIINRQVFYPPTGDGRTEPRNDDEGEAITISGDRENGTRFVLVLRGAVGLNVSLEAPDSERAIVTWQFNDALPLDDRTWLIDN